MLFEDRGIFSLINQVLDNVCLINVPDILERDVFSFVIDHS